MARPRYASAREPRPAPLPPETRTVGQLVAETLRLYGQHFLRALPLGLPFAAVDLGAARLDGLPRLAFSTAAGAVLLSAAYVAACVLASGARPPARALAAAYAAAVVAFLPFPALASAYLLPGVAWLALVGLAVPAAVSERLDLPGAFRRGVQLARADFVHALGSLGTLAILYFLTRVMVALLLRGQGDQTEAAAAFLADLVIAPVLVLGAALLYVDQAAREAARRTRPAE